MKKIVTMCLLCVTVLLIVGCESGELGIKVKVEEAVVPAKLPEPVAEETVGTLTIVAAENVAQSLLKDVAKAFNAEDVPDGVLTFTKLSVSNRSMQHPPRASGEIDATCIWQETDEDPVGYTITVRTFSIEIDDWDTQPKWLRDQAVLGMVEELSDTL